MAIKLSVAARNASLDALTTTVGGSGLLRIYDGAQPSGPGTAVTTQVLLAELGLNATFAPAASSGTLTLNSITQDSSANASGTASWFRIVTSGGTAVIDGSVSTSGADMNLNSTSIVSGGTVSITSATFTAGNA